MGNTTILNLPMATALSGADQFEIVQSGTSRRTSLNSLGAYGLAGLKAQASALGVAPTDNDMGVFTGVTIPSNVSAKVGMQSLETALETTEAAVALKAQAAALGVVGSANDMGSFTGGLLAAARSAKTCLQTLSNNTFQFFTVSTATVTAIAPAYYGFRTSVTASNMTLPPLASSQGLVIQVADLDFHAGTNNITITGSGTDVIALYGTTASTQTLNIDGAKASIWATPTYWSIVL